MAITTLDGLVGGFQLPYSIFKAGTAPESTAVPHSHWYAPGIPGAGVAPSAGINGAALSGPVSGQLTRANPGAGNAYLGRLALSSNVGGTFLLCDRLWANSGLSITSTSSQAITPAALPSRDRDGSTNGVDVLAGLEVSTLTGAGTPTVTLTYTDSGGTAGNVATFAGLTASNVGTFYMWPLAAGDVGVRSVQAYQQSATWTSGAIHIVLFRILAVVSISQTNIGVAADAVTSGMPRIYNDSVPFLVQLSASTSVSTISGQYIEAHG